MEKTDKARKKLSWRLIATFATLVVLALLIYSVRQQIADVISNLGKVNAFALLLIIPLQALNYDAYARLYKGLFKILGKTVKYWPLYRINLELNFVNHILPSGGVSGISYFTVRMRSLGVRAPQATLSQVMKFLLLFISYQPLLIIGLIFLAARGHANNLIIAVASSLITLLIVGTLLGMYIIESRDRINSFLTFFTKFLNGLIHLVRPKHPETINVERAQQAFVELHENYKVLKRNWSQLKWPLVHTTIANITEIASVYVVYIAFGHYVNIGAIILAYAVANFAGLISVLPAGVGIYEGLMTAVLAAAGIPAALSIPVTIMYRVLNMFVQLVPGYILYQDAVRKGLATKA
jgi:uncharacterized protein (TIRG00374 family)